MNEPFAPEAARSEQSAPSSTRVILVTGKGGVGKTTLSAATAVRAAERGARTLLVSTDEAHSLEDVLLHELGADPVPIGDGLDGLQIDGRHELQRSWTSITGYLRRLLGATELDRLQIDELIVVPGLDQLVALARLRELVHDGRWDAIVVDCAPSADSLRLLALPDALRWYVERLFGRHGTLNKWARRRIERTLAVPLPDDSVVSSITEMTDELSGLRATLDRGQTTARVVVTPERVVIAEAQRTLGQLALYGYATDAILVNRVPGAGDRGGGTGNGGDGDPWAAAEQAQLGRIDAVFADLPRLTVRRRRAEPLGLRALRELGHELYDGRDPLATLGHQRTLEIETRDGATVLRLLASGLARDRIGLVQHVDKLVVSLGTWSREVVLPAGLAGRRITRAGLQGDHLEVVFEEPSRAG